jgi:predicted RNA-binding protein
MLRKSTAGLLALLVSAGALLAADKETTGKIVKIDADKKIVTITTDDGKKDFTIGADTKYVDEKGKATKDGIKDKRLIAGAEITITTAATGKTIKELQINPVKTTKETKVVPKETVDPKKDPKKDVKEAKVETTKEIKGTKGTVTKIDAAKNTFLLTTEEGKKMEFSIGDKTEFIGPRGGVSKEGVKDDRFVAGAEVIIVTGGAGKAVAEVHLPYRKSEKDEKDAKKKDK